MFRFIAPFNMMAWNISSIQMRANHQHPRICEFGMRQPTSRVKVQYKSYVQRPPSPKSQNILRLSILGFNSNIRFNVSNQVGEQPRRAHYTFVELSSVGLNLLNSENSPSVRRLILLSSASVALASDAKRWLVR